MHEQARAGVARSAILILLAVITACTNRTSAGAPSITFTQVPDAAEGGEQRVAAIAGRVSGARPNQRVVLFAKSGIWWIQPLVAKPFTDVAADGTWENTTHFGLEYAALLVDETYQPPPTTEALPAVGGPVAAIVTQKGGGSYTPRPRQVLTFSGYEWEVRQTPSDRGGSNEYDPRNARVDDAGMLHLLLTRRDERWTSAEIHLTRSLGYGTYTFVVHDTSRLDPSAALGLLTWDIAPEQNHRELDVEISRWGIPENKDTQYVVQPHYVAANVYRFKQPAGRLTHSFRWEPDHALFQTSGADGRVVARREFTSGVPVPGTELVHVNLLYYRGSPRPPSGPVEVVVEKFVYLP
jgi:hypothetical protein